MSFCDFRELNLQRLGEPAPEFARRLQGRETEQIGSAHQLSNSVSGMPAQR